MGEYFREDRYRIQAGFALNTGKLLAQYLRFTAELKPQEKYEATLTICALQALLTNCAELLKAMKRHHKTAWAEPVVDLPRYFRIKRSFIITNTFGPDLTHEDFITHLRNALSHPSSRARGATGLETTGYTTVPDGSGVVTRFRFVSSPWVDRGNLLSRVCSLSEDKVKVEMETFERKHRLEFPLDVRSDGSRYRIYQGKDQYLPVFIAELSLVELTELALDLSNHLAQPTMETWDGETNRQLVA